MYNSILKHVEEVCLCVHAFWKGTTGSNLLILFSYHLKKKILKKWKDEK